MQSATGMVLKEGNNMECNIDNDEVGNSNREESEFHGSLLGDGNELAEIM